VAVHRFQIGDAARHAGASRCASDGSRDSAEPTPRLEAVDA